MSSKCLVIIGNGFDLAHGFPTSFYDFSEWLLKKYVHQFHKEVIGNQISDTFTEEMKNKFSQGKYQYNAHKHIGDAFEGLFYNLQHNLKEDTLNLLKSDPALFAKFFRKKFIVELYLRRELEWFAIENTYFRFLYSYAKKGDQSYRERVILDLNSQLEQIKKELRTYLRSIEISKNRHVDKFLSTTFKNYSNIVFVDFNYTGTIKLYLNSSFSDNQHVEVINVHGTIVDENEIFGYGDDKSDEYQELKSLEEDYFLENFKTINYNMDKHYQRLIERISPQSKFDVHVLGHSFGRTDKTLLNEIFDHPNAKKIHLYKRLDFAQDPDKQYKSFKNSMMAISRIMLDESDVRSKVVNFQDSPTFPS